MGVILDSSVIINSERNGSSVVQLARHLLAVTGESYVAISAIAVTELVHGIYRAKSVKTQLQRKTFLNEVFQAFTVYPYTADIAELAGKIAGEQQNLGVVIPFADLLIGVTALSLGFSLVTTNVRHFRLIPGLLVVEL